MMEDYPRSNATFGLGAKDTPQNLGQWLGGVRVSLFPASIVRQGSGFGMPGNPETP